MHVKSIGWRTDLRLRELEGAEIAAGADHLVVRTPANRDFRWGNFILHRAAPGTGDAGRWIAEFNASFGDADYVAIGIDSPSGRAGALEEFVALGLRVEVNTVLSAARLDVPGVGPPEAVFRPVQSDSDWRQAIDLSLAADEPANRESHRRYLERRMAAIRRVCSDGHGAWFGAFRENELHSGLGIFATGSGVARFQAVDTHPAHRRQGLATHLVFTAGRYAFTQLGARTLVIAADPDHHAINIYRALGFIDQEHQIQLEGARG